MKMPAAMRRVPEEDEFKFEVKPKLDVGHGRHPYKVDLRVLRDGFPDKRLDAGVSGRPDLAREVLPAFKSLFQSRGVRKPSAARSEETTSELQSLMRISYAVFCLKKNK